MIHLFFSCRDCLDTRGFIKASLNLLYAKHEKKILKSYGALYFRFVLGRYERRLNETILNGNFPEIPLPFLLLKLTARAQWG